MNCKNRFACVDPYMLNRLYATLGKALLIQTRKDTLRGSLIHVQPDHIVLYDSGCEWIVHTEQIVLIMPE
ncbi:DUF2642 domain-containing protein [Alkalihalobacillus sp. CinArs1]|uniref:DUF2642 domain-containing protein n=1 Tax=Alkalihalobacillus sp. CinArs1 TaxID=2995314 RepID=UPI0022DE1E49|nr:DUF2642 domain-containing protein [Alkalihalobacillus sp. CinArs1]